MCQGNQVSAAPRPLQLDRIMQCQQQSARIHLNASTYPASYHLQKHHLPIHQLPYPHHPRCYPLPQ
ncbi:uncharacterized protein BKA78DRAFT_327905 [Phyllosticta capitalensis]|uniref:uncharacterized protein n=1 Tax=Phyllosticta capitalensis TaxID=121624 RepID=UPI00312FB5D9